MQAYSQEKEGKREPENQESVFKEEKYITDVKLKKK